MDLKEQELILIKKQLIELENRIKRLEDIEKDKQKKLQEQINFENKRDESMAEIGHDMPFD